MSEPLLQLALVVVLGIGAQVVSWRLRLPSILLLLLAGFLAGPVTGVLDPDALLGDLLRPLVGLAVAVILFEGGLTLRLHDLRGSGIAVGGLITVGFVITWIIAALGAAMLLGLSPSLALLLGAILTVSGPTVVGPLLRHVRPSGPAGPILRWEGILIDPLGAILALLAFKAAAGSGSLGELATTAALSLGIGAATGAAAAGLLVLALRRRWVPDFLDVPVTILLVVASFAGSDTLQAESGLVAVTVMGVILANQQRVGIGHILTFKENLTTLLVSALFILLAARLDLEDVLGLGVPGLVFLALLVFVARPLAVFASTLRANLTWRDRVFIAGVAPRGIVAAAVAAFLALELEERGIPGSERIIAAAFLTIAGTVVVYGLGAGPLARGLGLATRDPHGVLILGAAAFPRAIAGALKKEGLRVLLVDANRDNVLAARLDGLDAVTGNLLSTQLEEQLDLGGIGWYLGMTHNDEANALGAVHWSGEFGRARACQLAVRAQAGEEAPGRLGGRILWAPDATYAQLRGRYQQGWRVRRTPITQQFEEADYAAHHPDALRLFVIRDGALEPYTSDAKPKPHAGSVLLSLAPPKAASDA